MPRKCKYEGCSKRPSFNFVGESVPAYCVTHSSLNMVDVSSKFCRHEGCGTHPSFNYPTPGNKIGLYCCAHKLDGMTDVRSRKCVHESGCATFPTFNYEGEHPGRYCSKHKLSGMVDVRNTTKALCRHVDCNAPPNYNFPDKKGARFCEAHKLEGMVCKIVTCQFQECSKAPKFGFPDEPPTHCGEHCLEGMAYTYKYKQYCAHDGCKVYPSFNFQGLKGKRFCATHKLEGMVETKRRTCEAEGCMRNASFNHVDLKRRRFCASHREPGMVTVGRKKVRANKQRSPEESESVSATDALIACLATLHEEAGASSSSSSASKRKLSESAGDVDANRSEGSSVGLTERAVGALQPLSWISGGDGSIDSVTV